MSAITYRGSYLTPPFEQATVADVMHRGILSCAPGTPVAELAELFALHRVHCLLVEGVERDGAGTERLVFRILDDLDLVRALAADGRRDRCAADVATSTAIVLSASDGLVDVARLMLEHGVTHAVVASERDERPVGVVSALDLAGAMAWGAIPGRVTAERR